MHTTTDLGPNTIGLMWYLSLHWSGCFIMAYELEEPRVLEYSQQQVEEIQLSVAAFRDRIPGNYLLEAAVMRLSRALRVADIFALLRTMHPRHLMQGVHFSVSESFHPATYAHLVILPHGILNNLPLSSLPVAEDNSCTLSDLYLSGVFTVPSIGVLKLLREKSMKRSVRFENLVAVQNTSLEMPGAEAEVREVETRFSKSCVLTGAEVTKQALLAILTSELAPSCVHFACRAEGSRILLAGGESLTSQEISALNFENVDLCVLSACESTQHDIVEIGAAFLAAGVPRVVTSLWKVNDAATVLLMRFLYQQLRDHPGISVASALRNAKLSLRQMTAGGVKRMYVQISDETKLADVGDRMRMSEPPKAVANEMEKRIEYVNLANSKFTIALFAQLFAAFQRGDVRLAYSHLFPLSGSQVIQTSRAYWFEWRRFQADGSSQAQVVVFHVHYVSQWASLDESQIFEVNGRFAEEASSHFFDAYMGSGIQTRGLSLTGEPMLGSQSNPRSPWDWQNDITNAKQGILSKANPYGLQPDLAGRFPQIAEILRYAYDQVHPKPDLPFKFPRSLLLGPDQLFDRIQT
eukprot:m.904179 g.904179  ORF g.904179 m.904179 type:complete len:579 (+) comp60070_c0_seq38:7151-8887(+)